MATHFFLRCLRRLRMRMAAMMHIMMSANAISAMPMASTLSRPALEDRFSSGRSALTYRVHNCPDLQKAYHVPESMISSLFCLSYSRKDIQPAACHAAPSLASVHARKAVHNSGCLIYGRSTRLLPCIMKEPRARRTIAFQTLHFTPHVSLLLAIHSPHRKCGPLEDRAGIPHTATSQSAINSTHLI